MDTPIPDTVKDAAQKVLNSDPSGGQGAIDKLREAFEVFRDVCKEAGMSHEQGNAYLHAQRQERARGGRAGP